MTAWIDFVKEYAEKHKISYPCALSKPECSAAYHKKYGKSEKPKKSETKEGKGVSTDKKVEIKTLSNVLDHLTTHIKDPEEPIDPKDYKQATEIIQAIKREKKEDMEHMKGGTVKKSKYVVQSVIFSKDKWTTPKAKAWLRQHSYKAPKVDKKEEHLRFRQLEPDYVEKEGYTEYRTKPLDETGISLILAYKKRTMRGKGAIPTQILVERETTHNKFAKMGGKGLKPETESESESEEEKKEEGKGLVSSKIRQAPPLRSEPKPVVISTTKKLTKQEVSNFENKMIEDLTEGRITANAFYKELKENELPTQVRARLIELAIKKGLTNRAELSARNIAALSDADLQLFLGQIKKRQMTEDKILNLLTEERIAISANQGDIIKKAAIRAGILPPERTANFETQTFNLPPERTGNGILGSAKKLMEKKEGKGLLGSAKKLLKKVEKKAEENIKL